MTRSIEWGTPSKLFNALNISEGPFTLDVAASETNHKVKRYYSLEDSAFHHMWTPANCWMNPPYDEIGKWVEKAILESGAGSKITMLLPAWTETDWFHKILSLATTIYFIRKKIRFIGQGKCAATFGSIVAVFDPLKRKQRIRSLRL